MIYFLRLAPRILRGARRTRHALSEADKAAWLDRARRDAAADRKRGYVIRDAELVARFGYCAAMLTEYRAAYGVPVRRW